MADATGVLVGRLGGIPYSGGPGGGFRWAAWSFEGGGCIEVIEPAGANGSLPTGSSRRAGRGSIA